ncbi:MAG: hypothetical protein ACTSQF_11325 [Candidatus Heimdallarchaeaceae archaeon]
MNSKKNVVFFCIIISLLFIPFIPNQNVGATYIITEPEIVRNEKTIDSTPPKLLPTPPSNGSYVADSFDSIGIELATNTYFQIEDIYPFTAIPNNRIWDLTTVQRVLTSVDLFLVTHEPNFLGTAMAAMSSLKLDLEGTYIRGEDAGSWFDFNADENFLLVIMYNRLAQAFQVDGDTGTAEVLRSYANQLFSNLTTLFYHPVTNSINSTLHISKSNFTVIGGSPFSNPKATGLFAMANHISNRTSTFYAQAKLAVDTYRTNHNETLSLPSGDSGFLYRSTNEVAGAEYLSSNLQGNIFMNTAMMQISQYETSQGNIGVGANYYNWTDMSEAALKETFKSPITNLLHTRYDLNTFMLEEVALTYENSLYLSHSIEFKRFKLEVTGITPSFKEINDLFLNIKDNLFIAPVFVQAGLTESGAQLDLAYDIPHSNPHIVNYQGITMMMKFYPLFTMLVKPSTLIPNLLMLCEWFIDLPETTSIFKASNQSFNFNFEFDITSNTLGFIAFPKDFWINTTSLDGKLLMSSQRIKLNFTSDEGGDHWLQFQIKYADDIVFDFNLLLTFTKLIHITTEPTNPEITQLVDNHLILTVICEDETGIGIAGANVSIFIDGGMEIHKITDNGGFTTAFIPIDNLMSFYSAADDGASSFNTSIIISVYKAGYLMRDIVRDVNVKLNELVLDLNPAPEGKEGDDLTIYLAIETRIEAPLFALDATIQIDNKNFTDENGNKDFSLPSTIVIGKEYLKADDWVNVTVTVDVPGMSIHVLKFQIFTVKMKTLERIYYWIEVAFQSDIVKVVGSLSIVWALLWRQISLRFFKRLRRCPYCGDITKSKFPYCKNCGLKDMTQDYKKAVGDEQKEPRIIANERALFRRKPVVEEPPVVEESQVIETPPVIEESPVVEETQEDIESTYTQEEFNSQDQSFTRFDEPEDSTDNSNDNEYQF